jgi:hypothetical protein
MAAIEGDCKMSVHCLDEDARKLIPSREREPAASERPGLDEHPRGPCSQISRAFKPRRKKATPAHHEAIANACPIHCQNTAGIGRLQFTSRAAISPLARVPTAQHSYIGDV